ncbi:MAG TPA: hypothetical protein VN817_12585 [Solirubrobacteraceae bacterium]|nr:hypothetical protein [Solirubrobacteraceae bacterium]
MANRNKGGRARSRKRRRSSGAPSGSAAPAQSPSATGASTATAEADDQGAKRGQSGKRSTRAGASRTRAAQRGGAESARGFKDPQSLGERPEPPWHPVPLSELLILAGAIGTVVGLSRGISHGGPPLIAGLAAVVIGTAEVTLREHLSGYRSHTLILALLPTIVFHSAVVLIVAAFTSTPRALNVALLFVDAAIFAFLFKLLRARFQDARRERVFAGRR